MNFILERVFAHALAQHPDAASEGVLASATALIAPPQQTVLTQRHKPVKDPAKSVKLMTGIACHALVEQTLRVIAADLSERGCEVTPERRFFGSIAGHRISGSIDILYRDSAGSHIIDLKTTSAVTVAKKSRMDEWAEQVNVYAWLCAENGITVTDLTVVAWLTDWSPSTLRAERKGRKKSTYPETDLVEIPMPLWPAEGTKAFIKRKADELAAALACADGDLPVCEETWGGRRCARYCDVAPWCHQWNRKCEAQKGFEE